MKSWLFLPFILLLVAACDVEQTTYYTVDGEVVSEKAVQNSSMAEQFIDLVLTEPESASAMLHDEFTFRFMGKLPIHAQGNAVIKTAYDKDTYFSEFLAIVNQLLPDGIVLTVVDVIANADSAAVIMSGDAEGKYGEYDNEYVFTYKFKDGKIIAVDEYNSDYLVAKSLYGNNLIPEKYTNNMLIEYFWHTKGLNYTEESFASLVEIWNGMIDGMSCEMNGANIITPREQNDDFDFLWMIAWPSQEARDACLDEWVNGNEPKWREAIDGIIDVDLNNAFLFSTEVGRFPKAWNESNTFTHSYFFCTFNEGSNSETLHNYRADLNAITTLSDNHWYLLLDPMFDPDPRPDFVWLDVWPDQAARESDLAIWNSTDLPGRAAEMVTCGDGLEGVIFDGKNIR